MEKETDTVVDFDLPVVEGAKVTKPRVHIGGDTCVSCEG